MTAWSTPWLIARGCRSSDTPTQTRGRRRSQRRWKGPTLPRHGQLTPSLPVTRADPGASVGKRRERIERPPDVTEEERHDLQPHPNQMRNGISGDIAAPFSFPNQPAHRITPKTKVPTALVITSRSRNAGVRRSNATRPSAAAARRGVAPERAKRHERAGDGKSGRPGELPGRSGRSVRPPMPWAAAGAAPPNANELSVTAARKRIRRLMTP